jgi:RNA-binding protein YhbY
MLLSMFSDENRELRDFLENAVCSQVVQKRGQGVTKYKMNWKIEKKVNFKKEIIKFYDATF